MILYYTPRSHFSRKVRLLLDLLKIPHTLHDVGNVAQNQISFFGDNPLMKVPVLKDGQQWIIDSDHIAFYLTKVHAPDDPYDVFTQKTFDLNARAILNGVMLEEVKIILAKRTGIETENYPFFSKAKQSIELGVKWIHENLSSFDNKNFKYRDLHLLCLWEHLEAHQLIPTGLEEVHDFVGILQEHELLKKSSPPK